MHRTDNATLYQLARSPEEIVMGLLDWLRGEKKVEVGRTGSG